ncbi:MAG: hypothetical protein IJS60_06100 [Abditibacteriota bacterium]|nr:hypothetical protein [Abditibacteriota bacterium]
MKKSIFENRILSNSGSTLIEVLVTIFVLTAGLLVLFGMFPQGFNILKNSRNVGFAGGLMKDRAAAFTMRQENMPIAVVPCDDNGNTVNVINDNPNEGKPDVFVKTNGEYTEINGAYKRDKLLNSRKVIGESTVIPGGDFYTTANGNFYGGKYTLMFGPIDTIRDANTGKLSRFVVYGSPMTNLDAGFSSSNPALDMWNDAAYSSYWTEGGDGRLYLAFVSSFAYTGDYAVSMDYDRVYKISYLVRHQTTGQTFRKEGYIDVPDNYNGEWSCTFQDYNINTKTKRGTTQLLTVGNGYVMLPDSLEICRVFEEVTGSGDFTSDPYQFIMADPVVGTVMFNPIGSKVNFGDAGEKEPLKAFIDYLIYDPRINVKDIQFPRTSNFDNTVKINLGLGSVLSAGSGEIDDGSETENPDEPTFEGLIRGSMNTSTNRIDLQLGRRVTSASDLVISQSILIMDAQTGLRVFPITDGDIEIDYENGIVQFNTNIAKLVDWRGNTIQNDVPLSDRVLRYYFRTAEDWVVRMCKLPSEFILSTDGTDYNVNDSLEWNEYGFRVNGDRLYFPQAYAGGDIIVDYVSTNGKTLYGQLYRISDYPENDDEASCYVDLGRNVKEIISCKGTSVSLGAYWRSGDEFRSRQMIFDVYGK